MEPEISPQNNIGATNSLAVVGLILSISFIFIGPFGSIPGLICSRLALKEYRRANIKNGQGMAKAGFVIGVIGAILSIVMIVVGIIIYLPFAQEHERMRNLIR